MKQLKANTRKKMHILCQILGKTALYFKKMYVESDHYRRIKLLDIQNGVKMSKFELDIIQEREEKFRQNRLANLIQERIEKKRFEQEEKMMFFKSAQKKGEPVPPYKIPMVLQNLPMAKKRNPDVSPNTGKRNKKMSIGPEVKEPPPPDPKEVKKMYVKQLEDYFKSPFSNDKRFVLEYLSQVTREKLHEHEDVIDKLFYDGIYNVIINPNEEPWNVHLAFDILGNMIESPK